MHPQDPAQKQQFESHSTMCERDSFAKLKCLLEGQGPDGSLWRQVLVHTILGLSLVEPVMVDDIFYTLPSASECASTLHSLMALLKPADVSPLSAPLQFP